MSTRLSQKFEEDRRIVFHGAAVLTSRLPAPAERPGIPEALGRAVIPNDSGLPMATRGSGSALPVVSLGVFCNVQRRITALYPKGISDSGKITGA